MWNIRFGFFYSYAIKQCVVSGEYLGVLTQATKLVRSAEPQMC